MKIKKIENNNSRCLTFFFSGWAASPIQFRHLRSDSAVWIAYDYRDLQLPPIPENYAEIHVVAWSLGVWVASQVFRDSRLASATAMNGTPFPNHDQWGIPRAVFQGTLEKLDENNFARFCRRMCGSKTLGQQFEVLEEGRIPELKDELAFINRELISRPANESFPWSRALISRNDHIFPFENLRNYWCHAAVPVEELDAPHHPFHLWSSWEELWMR